MTPKVWKLSAYTVDTFTDLVAEDADVSGVIVSNTDLLNDAVVVIRHGTGDISGSKLIPAGDALRLNAPTLRTSAASPLQAKADRAGVVFTASGLTP
tara:strand:+ start:8111 stop:8401 length:291 start_codon:yes stop_codon:yes gene_type:complete